MTKHDGRVTCAVRKIFVSRLTSVSRERLVLKLSAYLDSLVPTNKRVPRHVCYTSEDLSSLSTFLRF